MSTTSLLLNHPLPRDAVELGRLVLNPRHPEEDFCQPNSIPETVTHPLSDLVHTLDSECGISFKLSLIPLISISPSTSAHVSTSLSSHSFVSYQLRNSGDYFSRACNEPAVRAFLEKVAPRRFGKVFLVCGFKTLEDAHVRNTRKANHKLSSKIHVPASLVASAVSGGVPLPLLVPQQADVDIVASKAGLSQKTHEEAEYTATGEQVFAVQRKVNFSWFSTNKVESAYLEAGNRWKLYGTLRGEGEDGIEADLNEGAAPPDLLTGDYESFDLDGETIVFQVGKEDEEEEAEEESREEE